MLGRLHTVFAGLPALMRIGLLIVLAGGALDILYHVLPAHSTAIVDTYLGQGAWFIHLVALVGMATTMVGIFAARLALATSHIRHAKTERSHAIED
jgi:hypothetical protein